MLFSLGHTHLGIFHTASQMDLELSIGSVSCIIDKSGTISIPSLLADMSFLYGPATHLAVPTATYAKRINATLSDVSAMLTPDQVRCCCNCYLLCVHVCMCASVVAFLSFA